MNRERMDTVIGVAGAVALVFTALGVFAYEYNSAGVDDDDGPLGTLQVQAEAYNGTLSQGSFFENTFTPGEGVDRMSVVVEWIPTAPQELGPLAACEYELLDPDGTILSSGPCTDGAAFSLSQAAPVSYTIRIGVPDTALGGDFFVEASYDYGA